MATTALAGSWSRKLVSDWTQSGADAPCSCPEEDAAPNGRRAAGRNFRTSLTIGLALWLALASHLGHARDRGRFANSSPEMKAWFESLKSGQGPCCSDADGTAVSDVDWQSGNGHYRVRLDGEWVDVPDDAVITEPNRVGRAMVWPLRGYLGLTIRCFMPGSMT
jgi:hypothetical protein